MRAIDKELVDMAFSRLPLMEAVDLLIEFSVTEIVDDINHRIRIDKIRSRLMIGVDVAYPEAKIVDGNNGRILWRQCNHLK